MRSFVTYNSKPVDSIVDGVWSYNGLALLGMISGRGAP